MASTGSQPHSQFKPHRHRKHTDHSLLLAINALTIGHLSVVSSSPSELFTRAHSCNVSVTHNSLIVSSDFGRLKITLSRSPAVEQKLFLRLRHWSLDWGRFEAYLSQAFDRLDQILMSQKALNSCDCLKWIWQIQRRSVTKTPARSSLLTTTHNTCFS